MFTITSGILTIARETILSLLKYHFASLKLREEIGDKGVIADSYNNIGEVYRMQARYPEALNNQLIALKIREEMATSGQWLIRTIISESFIGLRAIIPKR